MKILILSLPRTGSSALLETLGKKYNCKIYGEPFGIIKGKPKDASIDIDYWDKEDSVVVKSIINQQPHKRDEIGILDFQRDFVKRFDEVILLSRRDLKACAQSIAFLSYN